MTAPGTDSDQRPVASAQANLAWYLQLDHSLAPLRHAAERFIAQERLGSETHSLDSLRGAHGLKWLARQLRSASDRERLDERLFVEGAGAFLGLLLVDHVGAGECVRRGERLRVRLGPRGWFDPFATVEGVMQSDDPVTALRSRVMQAEAEATDEGVVSRVLVRIEEGLRERQLTISDQFETNYRLDDGTELELHQLVESTKSGNQSDVARGVKHFLSMLDAQQGGTRASRDWETLAQRVYPRVVPDTFLEKLDQQLLHTRLDLGISVTWVEQFASKVRFLHASDLDQANRSLSELHQQALKNLAGRSKKARFLLEEASGARIVVAQTRDGLDASRLLLPGLPTVLTRELGRELLVAIPHRDTLLASAPAHGAELQRRCLEAYRDAPHRISDQLFSLPLSMPPLIAGR